MARYGPFVPPKVLPQPTLWRYARPSSSRL